MKNVDNYLDDVLVHTRVWEAHVKALREFFQRVRNANLTLNASKCEIGVGRVRFLGHQLDDKVLSPVNELVEKVLESGPPETIKQLRYFLGLAGYYRKGIPNFAELAAPLTDLTKKGCPHRLNWQAPQDRAFRSLKAYVASPQYSKFRIFLGRLSYKRMRRSWESGPFCYKKEKMTFLIRLPLQARSCWIESSIIPPLNGNVWP